MSRGVSRVWGWLSERWAGEGIPEGITATGPHDWRAPCATVHQAATLLLDGAAGTVNEQQTRLLAIILERTEYWLRRLDKDIGLPRWEASGRPLRLTDAAPEDVLREAAAQVRGLSLVRETAVHVTSGLGLPALTCDRHRLVQAVTMVLAAALSGSPRGSRIQVSAEPAEAGEWHLEIHGPAPAQSTGDTQAADEELPEGSVLGSVATRAVSAILEAHGGRFTGPLPGTSARVYRMALPLGRSGDAG